MYAPRIVYHIIIRIRIVTDECAAAARSQQRSQQRTAVTTVSAASQCADPLCTCYMHLRSELTDYKDQKSQETTTYPRHVMDGRLDEIY